MKIIRTGAAVSAIMLFFIYSGLILPVTVQRHAGNHREVMARILTDAGYPLTSAQLERLKGIEPGQRIREKIRVILTDKQKKALKNAFKERDAPRHGFMIVKILEEGRPAYSYLGCLISCRWSLCVQNNCCEVYRLPQDDIHEISM